MRGDQIAQVRQFNRLVTQRVGALDDHFLGRGRPLGASRLLYEIGERGADLRELRQRLGVGAGYVRRTAYDLTEEGVFLLAPRAGAHGILALPPSSPRQRRVRQLTD